MTDPIDAFARRRLAPWLDGLPEAPTWEELAMMRTRPRVVPHASHGRRWVGALAITVLVSTLGATALVFRDTHPDKFPAGHPLDVTAAVNATEAWWDAVIRGDREAAVSIAHPEAEFAYDTLTDELLPSLGEVRTVAVDSNPSDVPPSWQLCFIIRGSDASYTGAMALREYAGRWLPWDQRQDPDRCVDDDAPPTSVPDLGIDPTAEVTTTPVPIDEAIPLRILAVRPNNPSLALIDLEARTTTLYPPGTHPLPLDAIDGAVTAPPRHFVVWTGGVARVFSDSLDAADRLLTPDPVREVPGVASSLRVIPTPDGKRAWLVQPGTVFGGHDEPTIAELVNIETGQQLHRYEIDGRTFPAAASNTGLLLDWIRLVDTDDGWVDEPGSHQVMMLLETGELLDLGPGHAVAASSGAIVINACAAHSWDPDCELLIGDVNGHNARPVPKPEAAFWISGVGGPIPGDSMPMQVVSPDGGWLLAALSTAIDINGVPRESTVVAVSLQTAEIRPIRDFDGHFGVATWSADGQWIALVQTRDVLLINFANPERIIILRDVIPFDHFVVAAG